MANVNPTIQNTQASVNTLTFGEPVTNPIIVLSSIGRVGQTVPVQFSAPIDLLFAQNVTQDSATQISGTEGYAVVRLTGTFTTVNFSYLTTEFYANFVLGAQFVDGIDRDGDGVKDHLDIDVDKDGITDNVEAQTDRWLHRAVRHRRRRRWSRRRL